MNPMLWRIKELLIKPFFSDYSFFTITREQKLAQQNSQRLSIIACNKWCAYLNSYQLTDISDYAAFRKLPLCEYDDIQIFVEQCLRWEQNILTTDEISYFARTAGTAGSNKLLPVTKKSLELNHLYGWAELIRWYVRQNPRSKLLQWKSLILWWWFFKNDYTGEYNIWFISAILQKEAWLLWSLFREPSQDIAFMHDWERKIDKIIETTHDENITSMGGVTSRSLLLLEKMLKRYGKSHMLDLRPNFSLYISWWVNFEPYRTLFKELFPSDSVSFYQAYNASEWFIGWQIDNIKTDLCLFTNHWIFYEFIDMATYFNKEKRVIPLGEVEIGVAYAIVITTYGWLYRYILWDVVEFSDTDRFLFQIVWRTKVCIDVFWEYMMINHADNAIQFASTKTWAIVLDYTAAPIFMTQSEKGQHERIVECKVMPNDKDLFVALLDEELQRQTSYYAWKRSWDVLILSPKVHFVPEHTFYKWFEKNGRLGGQSKIKKLSNSRELIDSVIVNF